jgi:acetyl esterase/lipase
MGNPDTVVPAENSLNFVLALRKAKVPLELHIYEQGGHGFGLPTLRSGNVRGKERSLECRAQTPTGRT